MNMSNEQQVRNAAIAATTALRGGDANAKQLYTELMELGTLPGINGKMARQIARTGLAQIERNLASAPR